MDWKEITTTEEWDAILETSSEKDQIILKHTTTCPVSTNALLKFEAYLKDNSNEYIDHTMLMVLEASPVSNKIEDDLYVNHGLPKIIYIKNKEKYRSGSSWSVNKAHINAVVS